MRRAGRLTPRRARVAACAAACALAAGCGQPVVGGRAPGATAARAEPPDVEDLAPALGLPGTPFGDCLVYADVTGDGADDLVMAVERRGLGVFVNSRAGGFLPFAPIPLTNQALDGFLLSCAAADLDDDGVTDLLVLRHGGQLQLLRGARAAPLSFEEVNLGPPLVDASFIRPVDFDRDGRMDLFVGASYHGDDGQFVCDDAEPVPTCRIEGASTPYPYVLLRQPGADPTFVKRVLPTAGYSNGGAIVDVDADGWPDVFSSNELGVNALFARRGAASFADVLPAHGPPRYNQGMGSTWGDVAGSACLYNADFGASELYCLRGDGTLADVAPATGIAAATQFDVAWAPVFWDADNDGYTDVYVGNAVSASSHDEFLAAAMERGGYTDVYDLLLGGGPGPSFVARRVAPTFMHPTMATEVLTAVGDFDGDGRQEVAVAKPQALAMRRFQLLTPRRPRAGGNHWIEVRLERAPSGPTNTIGATVFLREGGRVSSWQVVGSGGGLASSSTTAHFGLGARASVESIGVRWPDGPTEITWAAGPFPADRVARVVERR